MAERSWPERYRETLSTNDRAAVDYVVLTWRATDEAVALAIQEHTGGS